MSNQNSQLLKGVLGMLLLQLLHEAEDYGYAVVVRLHQAGFTDLAEGTVYPALSRLESKGLLESHLVASESGPARKYYKPTADGKEELLAAKANWARLQATVESVMGNS